MKLTEYFTDILTHQAQTHRCEDHTVAAKKITEIKHDLPMVAAQNFMPLRSPKGSSVSPIRLTDTYRSTLVLGDAVSSTRNGERYQKQMEEANERRSSRFSTIQSQKALRSMTPAVVID